MNLAYSETGRQDAPVLLWIHAFPVNRHMWKHQLEAFADSWRSIAIDLPGFGESKEIVIEPTIGAFADSVLGFLDQKGIDKAVMAGCSFGGYILFELWRKAPERIDRMILCNTRAEADSDEATANRKAMIEDIKSNGTGPLSENMTEKLLTEMTIENQPNTTKLVEKAIREANPEGVVNAVRAIMSRPDSQQTLAGINVPALILVGDEDSITPTPIAQAMHDRLAKSTLHIIPYAGHLSALENPNAANQEIRHFLEGHS